ncbi:MAG: HAMP domain-containing histidine kinase [Candidatus Peribacteria bacterium]|jgi:signal transduction histidine kinase|nr:HAMP domain-containing histidine kinase [Candidatus Peribacteria bacterium]
MQLKTSTKISLKFTFFTMVVLMVFSQIILVLFFETRYTKQQARLYVNTTYQPPFLLDLLHNTFWDKNALFKKNILKRMKTDIKNLRLSNVHTFTPLFPRPQVDVIAEFPLEEFTEANGYYKVSIFFFSTKGYVQIFYKEGAFFVYRIHNDKVTYLDVTEFIYAQIELVQLLSLWGIGFSILVYLISLYFVKSSFKNLKKLTSFAQHLDFDRLSVPLKISGHKHDEIKVISDALNASLERIHTQIIALQDFIANASHELKTPLMMINSEIDIAIKQKEYPQHLLTIKDNVKRLSNILEIFTLITRLESSKQLTPQKEVKLFPLIQNLIKTLKTKYPNRSIILHLDKQSSVVAHPMLLEIVIKNLLENAYKHSGAEAEITVIGTAHSLSVSDTGK